MKANIAGWLFLLVVTPALGVSMKPPTPDTWAINITPGNSHQYPLQIQFHGKLYGATGTPFSEIEHFDEAEQFIRFVIKTFNQPALSTVIELWHPDERDQLEFLGKDDFHIEDAERYSTGNALEIRFISRINYGNLLIYHVAAKGLKHTKVIRYTITQTDEMTSNRYFLTKALYTSDEMKLFDAYTNYLSQQWKKPH